MSDIPQTMQALVKSKPEKGLWLQEVAVPEVGPNDLLIRVKKTAICGTDLHIFEWNDWAQRTIQTPLTAGHEFMGEVAAIGSHVDGFSIGDRVSGEGHVTCGHCRRCRAGRRHLCRNTKGIGVNIPGAFANYLRLPAVNAFKLPGNVPDEVAAYLDPLGNAAHTALSFDLVGEDVLITGAGPTGVLACAIARHCGARHIIVTDVNDFRLELARRCGASRVVNVGRESLPDAMEALGIEEGIDVGLEMSGVPTALRQMLEVMVHGGHVALLGIPSKEVSLNLDHVIFKGLFIKGIYGREMFETWYKVGSMLSSGLDVTPVLTHHISASSYAEAFDIIESGQCGKIVLDWTS